MGPGSLLPPLFLGSPPDCQHGASRQGEAISINSADQQSAVLLSWPDTRTPLPEHAEMGCQTGGATTTTKGNNSKGRDG